MTEMIIDYVGTEIQLIYRDENNERVVDREPFEPYFYVKIDEKVPRQLVFKGRYGDNYYKLQTMSFADARSLEGYPLKKVFYGHPDNRYNVKKGLENRGIRTYQGDVDMRRLYCVDKLEEVKEYNLRKWYFDIEVQQQGIYHDAITVLSVYDNYTDTYHLFAWFPEQFPEEIKDFEGLNIVNHFHKTEEDMMEDFVSLMEEHDPDMILGWYVLGYDIPKVINRLVEMGIDATRLSPLRNIKGVYKRGDAIHSNIDKYINSAQPIRGRLTFCLMDRFERLWTDSQMGTLPSLKLDDCSKLVLGEDEGKVSTSKFQDSEFYERAWLEDTQVYLEYAIKDVKLCVDIDEKMNISENSLALQRLIKCPFESTFHNSQMAGVYFMRVADWIAPSGVKGTKENFEAAFVMNPQIEGTFGLHENVAVFDFKSLYPSMMASMNISWETKKRNPEEGDYPVWYQTPKNLMLWQGETDIHYCSKKDGLLPKAVKELMAMRDDYKKLRKEAKTDEEYRKWDSAQMATKRVVNAFYGILAKDNYGWGDMEMAKSITASARRAMRETAFKAQELGYEVIYGHTDSIFVKVSGVSEAHLLRVELNEYIKKVFREPVELEFEKFASKFFLSTKKNRYCGWLSWKDGEYLDEDKFFVMGFEMKKSNETKFAKTYQRRLLEMVSSFTDSEKIIKYCNDSYKQLYTGDVSLRDISKRSRLRQKLEDYKSIAGGVAGIIYYNQQKIGRIENGDSYFYFKMDNAELREKYYIWGGKSNEANYIAFRNFHEVDGKYTPDWQFIAQAEVIKKSELIFESLGWSIGLIKKDIYQKTLTEWF
jgi:DNA polymerase elongation subunit (family B)